MRYLDRKNISPSQFVSADEDNEVLKEKLTCFLEKMDPAVPLGIYECPYPYHRFVDTAILEMISKTGRFLFIKDTCAAVDLLKDKIAVVQGTPMKLYNTNARTLIESVELGAAGYCGVGANFFSEPYMMACNPNADTNHLREVKTLLNRVEQAIGQSNAYPLFAKYYLNRTGKKMEATCRIPQEPAGEWDDLTRWLQNSREEFIRATA